MLAPSLSTTQGRPVLRCLRYGASCILMADASTPTSTSIPASLSLANPRPATRGSGSSIPTTTRLTPASISASAQGGVRPVCEHGSSVTHTVDPGAEAPAWMRAAASAWRPPGGAVAPVNTSPPTVWITQPTHGLGDVVPRTVDATSIAFTMASESFTVAPVCGPGTRRARRRRPRSHPDYDRRSRSCTGSARAAARVRGLSPPVGISTLPREGT